jgi:hypothetical protein
MLTNIDHCTNYLKSCIECINKDDLHLNKKYCAFDDTIVLEKLTKPVQKIILQLTTLVITIRAIDNDTKCKSNGYIWDDGSKWHLYSKRK